MQTLVTRSLGALVILLVVMGALIFLPAGTLDYWQAWAFLAVFGAAAAAITLYLIMEDPKLLERRMRGGPVAEKEASQKIIQTITAIAFFGTLFVSALDHRFGWLPVSPAMALVGDGLIALGMLIVFFVFRQNSFASATIELAAEQNVVSTGLYALVRHPMYMGAFFYLAGIPLALGSAVGLAMIALMVPALVWRIFAEEAFLAENLPGCAAYLGKVRYRLIPLVW